MESEFNGRGKLDFSFASEEGRRRSIAAAIISLRRSSLDCCSNDDSGEMGENGGMSFTKFDFFDVTLSLQLACVLACWRRVFTAAFFVSRCKQAKTNSSLAKLS